MFYVTALIIIFALILALYRAFAGPTTCDRVLAVNAIGTKTVALFALIGFIFERPHFLDIALVYALINFTATIAFLKYKQIGRLG